MKNRWIYSMVGGLMGGLLLTFSACEDYESMNVDPYNPTSVTAPMLMSGTEKLIFDSVTDVYTGGRFFRHFPQYWASRTYPEEALYSYHQNIISDLFNDFYLGISNLQQVIELNSDPATAAANAAYGANSNQIAAAKILKVWLMEVITDLWGDVPYRDVAQLEQGVYYTRYDRQEEIYQGMLQELKEAVAMIDPSQPAFPAGTDRIYDGDAVKWKRFGNSLRCRLAVHLSKVDPHWRDYITEAVADGVFESIDDNALYAFSSAGSEYSGFYEIFFVRNRNDFTLSRPLALLLLGQNDELNGKQHPWEGVEDPRLSIYTTSNNGLYKGVGYGLPAAKIAPGREGTPDWSVNPPFFLNKDFSYPLMTYAELQFILCEYKGFSKEEYQQGVRASIRALAIHTLTDLSEEQVFAYIDKVSERVDAETVATQKFIELYLNGIEGWNELRRTGYPTMVLRPGEISDRIDGEDVRFVPMVEVKGDLISRMIYPDSESTLNAEYWREAVSRLQDGTNNHYSRMYWDVRKSTYDHPDNQ